MIKEIKYAWLTVKYIFTIRPFYIVLVLFSSLFNSAYSLFNIVIVKLIVDSIQLRDARSFYLYSALILIVGIFTVSINAVLKNITMPKILNSIRNVIHKKIYVKYMEYDFEQVNNKAFYDSYYYVLENSEASFVAIIQALGEFITSLITIIGVVYLVANYNWIVILCIVGLVLVSFICSIKIEKTQYNFRVDTTFFRRKIDYIRRVFYLPEYFKDIRINNVDLFYDSLDSSYNSLMNEIKKWGKILGIFTFFSNISVALLNLLSILIFGVKAISGAITIGTFTMLYSGSQKLSSSLIQFFTVFQSIYQNNLNIKRYHKFMEYSPVKNGSKEQAELQEMKEIQLEHISYRYLDTNIIHDFSASFKAGTMNFIVGKNGTGKSTLAHVIAGILKPQDGTIMCNDVVVGDAIRQKYMEHIAVVLQDFKIYNFNLLQNIAMQFSIDEKDENAVLNVLKLVGLDGKLSNLKNDLHTELSGEFSAEGMNFSLGELQRISLSRALYRNADILILDEFTSFSDSEIRESILQTIRELYKDRIVIMITHDYSCIQEQDKIICLNGDGSYHIGNKAELLSIADCDFGSLYNAGEE